MRADRELKCRLLWALARRHGWAAPVDKTDLVTDALPAAEQGRGRKLLEALVREPYLRSDRGDALALLNDPDSQALAAARLAATCGYTDLQIEATLSRFAQAGGFDAYDLEALRRSLRPWE